MRRPIPYGPFLLLDRIAIGGMAEVYVAIRREDAAARLHAVKRILPTLAEDRELVEMFLDEARLVVQLDHPGILPVHELGKHGDGYYIAMEYVAGRDLRALLDQLRAAGERLPPPLACHVAWRVADALDHAHRKRDAQGEPLRVVHRDVSPANVLLGFDGSVRIIDFGIAQAAIRPRPRRAVLRGKFGYMSPEMVRGEPLDQRSDVFALGAVLHEMLTGERLFTGASELAIMEKVRAAEVPPPSARAPGIPAGLDALVLRALARDPGERWTWASELRDALSSWTQAGSPAGDPPALARFMARAFPAELRAELDRAERLRGERPRAAEPSPEATIVALAPPPGGVPPPAPAPAPAPEDARGMLVALGLAALGVVGALLLVGGRAATATATPASLHPAASAAAASPPAAPGAPAPGLVVVEPRAAATLVVDGVAQRPPLAAGERRSVAVAEGPHRIELRTEDGRRAGATVVVRSGETSELLGVELD
jgi:serine/threonine-protein kinase